MSQRRYFTLEEANSLIPAMERRFGLLLQLRGQLRSTYQTLEQLGAAPGPGQRHNHDGDDETPEARRAHGAFRGLMEALQEELQQIEELGVEIKDLDLGLCDFLSQREGQDIYLCWRFGEKHIGFWHDLQGGYAARQHLDGSPAQ